MNYISEADSEVPTSECHSETEVKKLMFQWYKYLRYYRHMFMCTHI